MAKKQVNQHKDNGIPFKEETAGSNYAEFSVTRKPDNEIKTKRFLFILLYALVLGIFAYIFLVLTQMAPVMAIVLIIEYIVFLATWHLSKIEYTYIVEKGNLHVYKLVGRLKAKEVVNVKISENQGICPADDEDYANLLEGVEVTLDCSISAKSEDRYFAIFEINGKKTAVYFNAATKLLQMLHYYGGDNVVVTYVSH
jgi:hypothetical protein